MALQTKQDQLLQVAWDPQSHHALAEAQYLETLLPKDVKYTVINVIIQPNSSPHIRTLSSLVLTFVVAWCLQKLGRDVVEQLEVNGVVYQRSLRDMQSCLGQRYGVKWQMRFEAEFFSRMGMPNVIHHIITNRDALGKSLAPSSSVLALRAPCPTCADIFFKCPYHGVFSYNIRSDVHKLQFNCQLGNLILGLYYEFASYGYIEICGRLCWILQEQLLWRHLLKPILIVYTPLICDWSGAKVSKSWYLCGDAYKYLCNSGQSTFSTTKLSLKKVKTWNTLRRG
ncbi:hypothetical protein CPB84DRAFT_1817748 [Gymnopilus junonius]|uniref:Uncharacterized protein n=1 Tax=Gymnopilus junonius TaxID=109634 RepID=A0A9P5NAF5_GYMJU|nr:hypothetical protein CPB84DRAFT_1817748 [Gymnopilus junonius]